MKVVDVKDFESFSSFFRGRAGNRRADTVMRLLGIDRINRLYDLFGKFTGPAFTSRLLDELGVNYVVGNAERLGSLPEGAFITISNHPYGGLDGIMTIDLMAGIRHEYRFMVNEILSRIKTLERNFISVTPTGNKKEGITGTSIRGIRETLEHLGDGHPLGFFPSGAVSDFSLRDFRVRDRRWQESILHVIHAAKVPVLPIRFFDKNSAFFYFLGLINWRVRLLRLPYEVLNKKGQRPCIGIGTLISVEEISHFANPETLGAFLRKTVYEMPVPAEFIPGGNIGLSKKTTE